jgi:hypothetical protein
MTLNKFTTYLEKYIKKDQYYIRYNENIILYHNTGHNRILKLVHIESFILNDLTEKDYNIELNLYVLEIHDYLSEDIMSNNILLSASSIKIKQLESFVTIPYFIDIVDKGLKI